MQIKDILLQCKSELPNTIKSDEYPMYLRELLERPIFDKLREKYLSSLKQWYQTYTLPSYSTVNKVIFVYETRKHLNLEFLLYNLLYFAQGWGLYIVCSMENMEVIFHILGENYHNAKIDIVNTNSSDSYEKGRNSYNEFMKSPDFWLSIPSPIHWILTAEVDSYLRKPLPNELFEFDYCASLWGWNPELPGGGGITFRSVQAMKNICIQFPSLSEEIFAQDCWASEGICRLQRYFNPTFFMESCLQKEAIGVHQWWSFAIPFSEERLEYFDAYMELEI